MMGSKIWTALSFTIAIFGLLEVVNCGGNMPAKWWTNTHARAIHSLGELKELVQGEAKEKHIFIDFYMQGCHYCYILQEDFNRIADDMIDWFGKD